MFFKYSFPMYLPLIVFVKKPNGRVTKETKVKIKKYQDSLTQTNEHAKFVGLLKFTINRSKLKDLCNIY